MNSYKIIDAIRDVQLSDIPYLASNSVINHHVEGMVYLCLKRTAEHTIKIYIMDKSMNKNGGYLVHPHNHRYDFDTVVLHGCLHHLRFKKCFSDSHGKKVNELIYDFKTKSINSEGETRLYISRDDFQGKETYYRVNSDEIHTVKPLTLTILGINQYEDVNEKSYLYAPKKVKITMSKSFAPSIERYVQEMIKLKTILKMD